MRERSMVGKRGVSGAAWRWPAAMAASSRALVISTRSNDDGEPSGTAGKPIHSAIVSSGVDRVMVVVIRAPDSLIGNWSIVFFVLGIDDDLPPSYQNTLPRGGRVAGNGRSAIPGSIPYPRIYGETDMETQIHHLEQEAYSSVLRSFKAQADAITWGLRVGGVEIPDDKRLEFSLQYIHGIGRTTAHQILCDLNMENKITKDLSEHEKISLCDEVSKVAVPRDNLANIQDLCFRFPSDQFLSSLEKNLVHQFYVLSFAEEEYMRQKCRVQWLASRDRNTKFFRQKMAAHRVRNTILSLMDDQGVGLEDPKAIEGEIFRYYQKLLGSELYDKCDASPVLGDVIKRQVPVDMREHLVATVPNSEILQALNSIHRDKASGPDGFNSAFFLDNWEIDGKDFMDGEDLTPSKEHGVSRQSNSRNPSQEHEILILLLGEVKHHE
ncbi:hypothetical protein Vadar_021571 [Vaccinium darrowii]|uniref:Uncharacterized protein n=1 Tax=Vaccinium darrowii TaxID=229202 RepID=A0ACB7XJD8_9ERIC|nr:hypothetical protein Vadar_021571 [Vaccinium darrowii]